MCVCLFVLVRLCHTHTEYELLQVLCRLRWPPEPFPLSVRCAGCLSQGGGHVLTATLEGGHCGLGLDETDLSLYTHTHTHTRPPPQHANRSKCSLECSGFSSSFKHAFADYLVGCK